MLQFVQIMPRAHYEQISDTIFCEYRRVHHLDDNISEIRLKLFRNSDIGLIIVIINILLNITIMIK